MSASAPLSDWRLSFTARLLRAGAVIAYPTEAVWGLGCDPFNAEAVEQLLELKQRPWHKGLILIAADPAQIQPLLAPLTRTQREQLQRSWPGFQTWVLPDPAEWVPSWVKGKHQGVAVRLSAHPLVQQLCHAFGGAIVSTSANLSGRRATRERLQVVKHFHDRVDLILPGVTGGASAPSAIRDLLTGELLRSA